MTALGVNWLKRILVALALLLVIVVALPFFIQLDDYIPRIEKEASEKLKQPVSVKRIRFGALPLPHVTIEGITVGTSADVSIGTIVVTPDLFSLLQSTKVIKRVEIHSLALTRKAIDSIPAWIKPDAAAPQQQAPPVRVESIRLTNALVDFGKTRLGPFDARIDLDAAGALKDASIATQDGKLKARITPAGSKYLIEASAKFWTMPAGPALVFDELMVKGMATLDDADLGEISARLYGGSVAGKTTFSWRKGLQLGGALDVRQVELKQVAALLSPGARASGKLNAKPVFSASAAAADQIVNALRLETRFDVQNGALHGVDIEKAATSLIKQGTTGGETRFEELSGHLVMERGGYRFTELKIASGALAADGNVSISAKKELSGRINAQIKAAGTSAKVPLNVAGTLDSPLLYPTAGTVAGAAVGTAIMGPGLGTSVGAKVGGWAEDLFGKKEKKTPKK
jgi:uncharacterized protein involved in outer membrane biogenesis